MSTNEWDDVLTFTDANGRTYTDAEIDEAARMFYQNRMAEHEKTQQTRRDYLQQLTLDSSANAAFDQKAWDAETEKGRAEFEAYQREQGQADRDRTESENAISWMAANPRYKKTVQNA